jgi:hypothetical protein
MAPGITSNSYKSTTLVISPGNLLETVLQTPISRVDMVTAKFGRPMREYFTLDPNFLALNNGTSLDVSLLAPFCALKFWLIS